VGEVLQTPPAFSAIKIDGARAYDLARDAEEFELAPRRVSVGRLTLVDHPDSDRCVLEARCGKGTYVRALARDLGRALGAFGHVEALRRTRVGDFDEGRAVTLQTLEAMAERGGHEALLGALLPVETALRDLPALALSGPDADRLRRGQPVLLRGRDAPIVEGTVCAMSRGTLVALGEVSKGELKPRRLFNLPQRGAGR
jgi:tRNA pseudouridine55 synthase